MVLMVTAFFASFVWNQNFNLLCGMVCIGAITLAVCMALPHRISLSLLGASRSVQVIFCVMMGLFVWTWVRAFTSDVPATSIMAAGYYTTPLLVAAWVMLQSSDRVVIRTILLCLMLVATIALIGIGTAIYGDITGHYFRTTASRIDWPMQDANHYAMIMNVGVLVGLAMITVPSTRSLGAILALLCWVGVILAGSRAGTIALVIAFGVLAVIYGKTVRQSPRAVLSIMMVGGIILFGVFLVRPHGTALVTHTPALIENIDQSSGNRPMMWENTARLAAARPIWGYGTGTFIHVYPQTMTAVNYDSGYAAHNDWVQIWLEMGLPGAALYAALGVMIVVIAVRTRKLSRTPYETTARAAALGALTVLALHAQIEFMLMVMPVLILFGLALGVFVRGVWQGDRKDLRGTVRSVPALPIGVIVIMLSALSIMQTQAQIAADQSNAALNRGDLKSFAVHLERTSYYAMDFHAYPYLRTAHYQLALLMSGGNGQTVSVDDVQGAINAALARNPYSSTTYDIQGRLDQYLGRSPEQAWVKGLSFEPRNADLRLALLRLYERQGNAEKLAALIETSKNWPYMRGQFGLLKTTLKRYEK